MEKYEKIRIVGRGAYGTVYLCRRLADNKEVIIKEIPVEQMTKDERQAALNEVKVLSMLDHPNIIQYNENFLEDKALMIVMEYAQGGTMFDYLQSRQNQLLEEETILHFFAQMLLSLQHVHSKQILHRDLKTQNILLDQKYEIVKIGDFGISKVLSSKSKAYTVVGTPCYISPELCEGKPYNQKSDIWALGCVLYELASLKRAFEAQNLPALILKIMRGTFAPISENYSNELKQLILSMLHLDPNRRPTINQIMALPIVLNALMVLYTDVGKIPCRRMIAMSGPRGRVVQRTSSSLPKGGACNMMMDLSSDQPCSSSKPKSACLVWSWGGGIALPTKLPLPSSDTLVTQVAVGRTTKAAVTKNGRLFVWEAPSVGTESMLPGAMDSGNPMFAPRYLEGQSAVTIQHVSCGDLFTACLTDRGILMTFGSGGSGCLGHGNFKDVSQAKIVERLLGFEVIAVSCGSAHVVAVTNENEVFAWGRGDAGRLGIGSQETQNTPQQLDIPEHFKPSQVVCGLDCTMVITEDRKLLCCGSNRYNKLALDRPGEPVEEVYTLSPAYFPQLENVEVQKVAMGTSHAAVLSSDGDLYMLGSNQFGQLGVASKEERLVHRVPGIGKVQRVACGDTFTVAVNEEGRLFTWGKSARGRLGRLSDSNDVPLPVSLGKESKTYFVTSLSASHGTTLLVTKSTGSESNS